VFDWELNFDLSGFNERLNAGPGKIRSRLAKAIEDDLAVVEEAVRLKLTNQVLNIRTDNLRSSVVAFPVSIQEGQLTGIMGVGKQAWYGRIHEYGLEVTMQRELKLPSHPRPKDAVHPGMTGDPYTVKYPERSFFRSAWREQGPLLREQITAAFGEAVRGV
jgi:hypothetical protein